MQDDTLDKFSDKNYKNYLKNLKPSAHEWWENFFAQLERENFMERDEIIQVLKETFPTKTLEYLKNRIVSAKKISDEEKTKKVARDDIPGRTNSSRRTVVGSNLRKRLADQEIQESNPYWNFFLRHPKKAAVWRDDQFVSEEKRLTKIGEQLTEQMAEKYLNLLSVIHGEEGEEFSKKNARELFDITPISGVADTIKLVMREIVAVTEKVALSRHLPERSKRNALFREIRKDLAASKQKSTTVAFGKTVPTSFKVLPPKKAIQRWFKCDKIPVKEATMATVWEGITKLRSTMGFCYFLHKNRPDLKPPQYLIDCGSMDPEKLISCSRQSVHFRNSFQRYDID